MPAVVEAASTSVSRRRFPSPGERIGRGQPLQLRPRVRVEEGERGQLPEAAEEGGVACAESALADEEQRAETDAVRDEREREAVAASERRDRPGRRQSSCERRAQVSRIGFDDARLVVRDDERELLDDRGAHRLRRLCPEEPVEEGGEPAVRIVRAPVDQLLLMGLP